MTFCPGHLSILQITGCLPERIPRQLVLPLPNLGFNIVGKQHHGYTSPPWSKARRIDEIANDHVETAALQHFLCFGAHFSRVVFPDTKRLSIEQQPPIVHHLPPIPLCQLHWHCCHLDPPALKLVVRVILEARIEKKRSHFVPAG